MGPETSGYVPIDVLLAPGVVVSGRSLVKKESSSPSPSSTKRTTQGSTFKVSLDERRKSCVSF